MSFNNFSVQTPIKFPTLIPFSKIGNSTILNYKYPLTNITQYLLTNTDTILTETSKLIINLSPLCAININMIFYKRASIHLTNCTLWNTPVRLSSRIHRKVLTSPEIKFEARF